MSETASDTTEDAFLGGRLLLRQPRSGHRAGHDAMLLAAACRARSGERVVEFGAGVGAAGLALAKRVGVIELTLIEIAPALAALARHNAAANSIPAHVVVLDVTAPAQELVAAGLGADSVDAVLMNPPFNDPARHRASPDEARASAHVAKPAMLAQWIGAARRLLKSGGVVTLIWRAAGIAEALSAFDRGFGSLELLPVHSDSTKPAIRILIAAVKGGRAPTKIFPALMLNEGPAQPNKHVAEILAGQGVLPLARL